jgi:hypothetical protein
MTVHLRTVEPAAAKIRLIPRFECVEDSSAEATRGKCPHARRGVRSMTLEVYTVNAWAAEHLMTQPMAICWTIGRMWIAVKHRTKNRVFWYRYQL